MWHRFHYPVCRLLECRREVTAYPGSHFYRGCADDRHRQSCIHPPGGTANDIRCGDRSRHCDFSDSSLLQPATAPVSTGSHRHSDTIIGVTLIPVAILSAGGGDPTAPDFESLRNLAFAAGTLVLILMIYRFFRGFMSSIAVLLGLVVGTAVAAAFGFVDFSGVAKAGWLGVTTPFRFGPPIFSAAAIISMVVVMLITAVETTGDVFATGEIVEKRQ